MGCQKGQSDLTKKRRLRGILFRLFQGWFAGAAFVCVFVRNRQGNRHRLFLGAAGMDFGADVFGYGFAGATLFQGHDITFLFLGILYHSDGAKYTG